MNYTVIFNISHGEESSQYHKVYEVLGEEYNLKHFEMQDERKVLAPTTTVVGKNANFKTAQEMAESIIDRLLKEDITLDRILVSRGNDYSLIG
ncbi:MAG: hypothetical protein OEV78_12550 [Spirochaetia bacterium]|nr:hypothetical protein [Spirochaetia bacterium]